MSSLPIDEVPALSLHKPPSLRLAPNTRVPIPDNYLPLIDNALFQRLRGVKQLGYVERVYPSANHTRFEHSLGVYYKCIAYIHALWEDPHNTYVRDVVKPRHVRALLVAALFHDLGQYPLSHVLEDTERSSAGFLEDSIFDHELYSERLLTDETFRKPLAPDFELRATLDEVGVSLDDVLAIMRGSDTRNSEGTISSDGMPEGLCSFLHSIIDGPIDADKLDYLRRDSHHCGVEFSNAIDEGRFFQALTTVPRNDLKQDETRQIGLTYKGRVPAEQILMARYHMFTEVYWHRTVRAHEAVLASAVRKIRRYCNDFEDWFVKYVFQPRTSDEWLLSLLRQRVEDMPWGHGLSEAEKEHEIDIIKDMLESVSWKDGRNPYRALVSVSGEEDATLYKALQSIREVGVAHGEYYQDDLCARFAEQLQGVLNVDLDADRMVLDIPPRRSPATSVYLVSTSSVRGRGTSRLAEQSDTWSEFGEDFQSRTRKVRLFCPAENRDSVEGTVGHNESLVYSSFREVATDFAREVAKTKLDQTELDLAT